MRLSIEIGSKFGKLTVIKETDRLVLPSGQKNRAFKCLCECGNETVVRLAHLVRGRTLSCGCINPKHGDTNTKLYGSWRAMRSRILASAIDSHRYFDRGITICREWFKYSNFRAWALNNGHSDGLTLDRIDNSKGYYPENCRWVTPIENANNRDVTTMVEYNGEMISLSMLMHIKGIHKHYHTILRRIKRGWKPQRAIDTPLRIGNYFRGKR